MDNRHTIGLLMGDASGDGHDKREVVTIHSSLNPVALERAFKKGAKVLKCDITKYCEEYEDQVVPEKVYNIFAALDPECFSDPEEHDKGPGGVRLDPGLFAQAYLLTCKAGDPGFTWDIVEQDQIAIGGYGLFY